MKKPFTGDNPIKKQPGGPAHILDNEAALARGYAETAALDLRLAREGIKADIAPHEYEEWLIQQQERERRRKSGAETSTTPTSRRS